MSELERLVDDIRILKEPLVTDHGYYTQVNQPSYYEGKLLDLIERLATELQRYATCNQELE